MTSATSPAASGSAAPAVDALPDSTTHSERGFWSLIVTQFFGAANDNILKGVLIYMVIDGAWAGDLGSGGQGFVSACLTVPFILLSGVAGQFADRNSKRYVSVLVKIVEVPIALVGMIGFWTGQLWIALTAMIALACQSAFFGPAKYGMIPELVPSSRLSRANGMINMMTNIAVIVGTLAAGIIADYYSPLPVPGQPVAAGVLWLPGAAMLLVAIAGLVSISFLTPLTPGDPSIRYSRNPFAVYLSSGRDMAKTPLLLIACAGGYFYFLAGLALLILPEYTVVLRDYGVSRAEVSVLLAILGLAIGIGSVIAGFVSGSAIRPVLIPIGAAGITLFFVLLGTVKPTLPDLGPTWRIVFSPHALFILGAGITAGFYIIPLQALLQRLAPDDNRGRVLGTANCISFVFLTASSLLYLVLRPLFTVGGRDHPEKIFLVCAALMVIGIIGFLSRLKSSGLSLARVE